MNAPVHHYTPLSGRYVASRWKVYAMFGTMAVLLFTFFVSLRLDYNFVQSWFYVFIPLFVVQGMVGLLLLISLMHAELRIRNRRLDHKIRALERERNGPVHEMNDVVEVPSNTAGLTRDDMGLDGNPNAMGDAPDDAFLYAWRVTRGTAMELRLPTAYTLHEMVSYSLFILVAFWQECFLALQFNHTMNLSWGIVFMPVYIWASLAVLYYVRMIYATFAAKETTVLTGKRAVERAVMAVLILMFAVLLAVYLDEEDSDDRISLAWIWFSLALLTVIPVCWMFEYYASRHIEFTRNRNGTGGTTKWLAQTQYLSLQEVVIWGVIIAGTVCSVVFVALRVDDDIEWSWFAVLSPFMISLIMILVSFAMVVMVPSCGNSHDMRVKVEDDIVPGGDPTDGPNEATIYVSAESADALSNM